MEHMDSFVKGNNSFIIFLIDLVICFVMYPLYLAVNAEANRHYIVDSS